MSEICVFSLYPVIATFVHENNYSLEGWTEQPVLFCEAWFVKLVLPASFGPHVLILINKSFR